MLRIFVVFNLAKRLIMIAIKPYWLSTVGNNHSIVPHLPGIQELTTCLEGVWL